MRHIETERSRGRRVMAGVFVIFALVATACGGGTEPAADSSSEPSATDPATDSPTSEATPEGIGAELAASCGGDAQDWQDLVEAAQAEGALGITGPPDPDTSEELPRVFEERFGIPVEYDGGGGSLVAELQIERDNGVFTKDAMLIGANSMYTRVYPADWLDNMKDAIIVPELLNADAWTTADVPWKDPDGELIIQIAQSVIPHFTINTDQVEGETLAWEDLLDPEWKGKIISVDPSSGSGTQFNVAIQLLGTFGEEYLRDLYEGQEVALTSDARMAAEAVARGQYAVGIGIDQQAAGVPELIDEGLPIQAINATDALPLVSGGWALMGLLNERPHPKAGELFVNWMLCPDGNKTWIDIAETVSLRAGVEPDQAPPEYAQVDLKQDWWDVYDWDRVTGPAADEVKEIFPG